MFYPLKNYHREGNRLGTDCVTTGFKIQDISPSLNKQKGRTCRKVQPSVARPCFDLLMLRLSQHPPLSVPSLQKVWLYRVIHYYYFDVNIHTIICQLRNTYEFIKEVDNLNGSESFLPQKKRPQNKSAKEWSF